MQTSFIIWSGKETKRKLVLSLNKSKEERVVMHKYRSEKTDILYDNRTIKGFTLLLFHSKYKMSDFINIQRPFLRI